AVRASGDPGRRVPRRRAFGREELEEVRVEDAGGLQRPVEARPRVRGDDRLERDARDRRVPDLRAAEIFSFGADLRVRHLGPSRAVGPPARAAADDPAQTSAARHAARSARTMISTYRPTRMLVMDSRPVGVFDSGVGGLTVLHECLVTMPNEDFVFLGDHARLPYGPRPLA